MWALVMELFGQTNNNKAILYEHLLIYMETHTLWASKPINIIRRFVENKNLAANLEYIFGQTVSANWNNQLVYEPGVMTFTSSGIWETSLTQHLLQFYLALIFIILVSICERTQGTGICHSKSKGVILFSSSTVVVEEFS